VNIGNDNVNKYYNGMKYSKKELQQQNRRS